MVLALVGYLEIIYCYLDWLIWFINLLQPKWAIVKFPWESAIRESLHIMQSFQSATSMSTNIINAEMCIYHVCPFLNFATHAGTHTHAHTQHTPPPGAHDVPSQNQLAFHFAEYGGCLSDK